VYPIDPVAGVIITSCFALLFGAAGVHKVRDLRQFAEVFAAYDVLPGWLSLPRGAAGERIADPCCP